MDPIATTWLQDDKGGDNDFVQTNNLAERYATMADIIIWLKKFRVGDADPVYNAICTHSC